MTSISSVDSAPSIADLRKEFKRAYKMAVLTRQRGWWKAVARINREIMECLTSASRNAAPSVGKEA